MSELYEQKCAEHDTVAKVRDTLRHVDSEQRKIDMTAKSRVKGISNTTFPPTEVGAGKTEKWYIGLVRLA